MSILGTLRTSAPYHLLLYSVLFGSTTYQSFFSGIVAFKVLPYDQFSLLQSHVFPPYFKFQTAATSVLLMTTPLKYVPLAGPSLGISLVGSIANMLWLGPTTRDIQNRRREQEAKEGKSCKDPNVSDEMKAINKEFGKIHGYSVIFNMGTFLGLLVYGIGLSQKLIRVIPK